MNPAITIAPDTASDIASDVEPDTASDVEPDTDTRTGAARCADGHGTLAFLFFSDDDHEIARAKAICRRCELADDCLRGAVERGEPYGVWGGKLVLDGVPVEFRRKRGRPRKNPLPLLVVDEVPLPPHLVA